MQRLLKRLSLGAVVAAIAASGAMAAELKIGARAEIEMDPHFFWLGSNSAYYIQFYGATGIRDPQAQVKPSLATSWTPLDDKTWEFKFRKDAKYSDGTPFVAADLIASIKRMRTLPNVVNSYSGNVNSVVDMVEVDSHTIHFKTNKPDPLLPGGMANIFIIPKAVAESASTKDFASGKAAVSIGPYKFVEYVPGDRLVLERNEGYWGPKARWDKVTFKFISNDASRAAALLGGDVDLIDFVSPADVARLKADAKTVVHVGPSDRTIFLGFDVLRQPSPFITEKDSDTPLAKNPFKDIRVRKAFSMAMNRDAITKKVMEGLAFPAGQVVPPGFGGYDPSIEVVKYDPKGAKKLLEEAGFGDGFGLTVHCSSDRYVNDGKICQTVGQMLARIGIKMKVETMPKAVYFPKALSRKGDQFSFFMLGWGSSTHGEADYLWQGAHTYDKDSGYGVYNLGGYSNAKIDDMIQKAIVELDATKRHGMLQKTMAAAIDDGWVIPLHYQSVVVASRKGLKYTTRADEGTVADMAEPE